MSSQTRSITYLISPLESPLCASARIVTSLNGYFLILLLLLKVQPVGFLSFLTVRQSVGYVLLLQSLAFFKQFSFDVSESHLFKMCISYQVDGMTVPKSQSLADFLKQVMNC